MINIKKFTASEPTKPVEPVIITTDIKNIFLSYFCLIEERVSAQIHSVQHLEKNLTNTFWYAPKLFLLQNYFLLSMVSLKSTARSFFATNRMGERPLLIVVPLQP